MEPPGSARRAVPWNNHPPRDLAAVDLPGGPGVVYLGNEHPELILLEVMVLREPGGQGKVYVRTYDCY